MTVVYIYIYICVCVLFFEEVPPHFFRPMNTNQITCMENHVRHNYLGLTPGY